MDKKRNYVDWTVTGHRQDGEKNKGAEKSDRANGIA